MVCILVQDHPLKHLLPYVTCWPRDAPNAFYEAVSEKYFAPVVVNRFCLCVLLHRAETEAEAIQTLSGAGAFASHGGRAALLNVVGEARNTVWCKPEILDTLERYATYAFVLEGMHMTCGLNA